MCGGRRAKQRRLDAGDWLRGDCEQIFGEREQAGIVAFGIEPLAQREDAAHRGVRFHAQEQAREEIEVPTGTAED